MHALLNVSCTTSDILLITELWYDNIGGEQRGAPSHQDWQPILPVQPIPADKRPRVMAYVRRRGDFSVTLCSDLANDLDIMFLEVRQGANTPFLIGNVYNGKNSEDNNRWSLDRFLALHLPADIPHILTGDWNAHHTTWEDNANNPP
ncbi:hypothetical protein K439DRAFT_1327348 [Ramaria rubella]|nr:hypothetical protein K439DRAFT_1327348 [Ramaria rubella]